MKRIHQSQHYHPENFKRTDDFNFFQESSVFIHNSYENLESQMILPEEKCQLKENQNFSFISKMKEKQRKESTDTEISGLMDFVAKQCNQIKVEHIPETMNKKCKCTKSNCLKNYCECFKLGIKCNDQCECKECRNQVQLFLPLDMTKVKRTKCKCKKSKCLKKYCQCHANDNKCGKDCNCQGCENVDEKLLQIGSKQCDSIRKRIKLVHQQYFDVIS